MGRRRMMGKALEGLSPDSAPDGAYIYTDNRRLFTRNKWDTANNNKVSGIAVIRDTVKYVMYLKSYYGLWSNINELVNGVSIANSVDQAKNQFDGIPNTNAIVARNYTESAAKTCKSITFKHGENGYLGSFGEWYTIMYYASDVTFISNLIGASFVVGAIYWTSTQYNRDEAWSFRASPYSYTSYYKSTTTNFIPFAKL